MSVNSGNASFDSSSSQGIYKPLINNSAFTTEDRIRIQEQWHRETTLTSYCSLRRFATILFSVVTMTGQLMQYLSLPLWIDSTSHSKGTSTNQTVKRKPSLDSYFVVSFASFSFVIVFGSVILLCDCIFPKYLVTTDWRYRRLLLLVGLIMGTAAMFIVFSSSGKRTPPYLQAILGNFSIPFTILLRFLFLKKVATRRKLISAMVVLLGLFICLIPTIFPRIDSHVATSHDLGGATGPGRILWPLAFMFGFGFSYIGCIIEEKAVKMRENIDHALQVSLVSVLFWTSLSQFLAVVLLFWADIVPGFGYTNNIKEFLQNWMFGLQCVFGGAGCSWIPGVLAFLFITGYITQVCGQALMLRYSEGATLLVIVMSLCTPLGFIFWMLFEEKPFRWNPTFHTGSWFTVFGLLIMMPAAFIYNTGMPERDGQREELNSPYP